MAVKELDCTNLRCPMPLVKISKAMKEIAIGDELTVDATDLAFKADIEAWARKMGHTILEFSDGPVKRVLIRKCK
jgi:tRNA 2-thiouridine synthesizing protein A